GGLSVGLIFQFLPPQGATASLIPAGASPTPSEDALPEQKNIVCGAARRINRSAAGSGKINARIFVRRRLGDPFATTISIETQEMRAGPEALTRHARAIEFV